MATEGNNVQFARTEDRSSHIVMDGRYSPYLLFKAVGTPDLKAMKGYFEFRDRYHDVELKTNNRGAIAIVDITATGAPPSTVRKAIGEMASNDVERGVSSIMVVTNPLLRGVMTAIVWVAGGDNLRLEYAPSLTAAIEMARKLFESRGFDTEPPKNYEFPVLP
jgi:hypothetical protein